MDDFNNQDAGNHEGLEYDEEQDHGVQITNPDKDKFMYNQIDKEQVAQDIVQPTNEVESEQEEPVVDNIPSFFSQRFASDLIRNESQDDENEDQENINIHNSLINKIGEMNQNSDCFLNINTIQMKQLLGQEKMAPELLPYQNSLVETISKQITQKDRQIQQRAQNQGKNMSDERFYLNIERMEVERVKYMLKAYLRSRIIKIERHLLYIIEKDQATLLSQAEMEYAWQLYEAKKDHYNKELFSNISTKLNMMADGTDIPDNMITKPNLQHFIFVRFLNSYQKYTIMGHIDIEIKEDNIYFLPYDQIKIFLEKGEAELV